MRIDLLPPLSENLRPDNHCDTDNKTTLQVIRQEGLRAYSSNCLLMEAIMRTEDFRKVALLYGMTEKFEEIVDRLLDAEVELPEARSNFHVTVNGITLCEADLALTGASDSLCELASLHDSIGYRAKIKAAFPGAIIAVLAGPCPGKFHQSKAA